MLINSIIVTTDSFNSENPSDLIASNTNYVAKLFQQKVTEEHISENALKSYYVDYYHAHMIQGNFQSFIKEFPKHHNILNHIRSGLKAIKADKHLQLFTTVFPEGSNQKSTYNSEKINLVFKKISEKEDLIALNHQWLMHHPTLLILNKTSIEITLKKHFMIHQNSQRHIQIIQQLCEIIDEEFVSVTAGDANNLYNRSWHFKTIKGYYYYLEGDQTVTLYNSFTKQEVIQGTLSEDKTKKPFLSNFISRILA